MKRRGFTLIELMVVIAIIIILAAIAIPNYLTMTARAKKSRVASDMNTVATALEAYKTDWGFYPVAAIESVDVTSNSIYNDLSGAADGTLNKAGSYNAVGEQGPISYIKAGTLTSIKNPLNTTDNHVYINSNANHWVLYVKDSQTALHYWSTTDSNSTLSDAGTAAPTPAA